MLADLINIAWGSQAGALNQLFSVLLITVTVVQLGRFLIFWDRINQWARAFVEAKLAFDNEHAVRLKSNMDELQPPHSASAQIWVLLPPVLIMLGLIGTFIGLTLALGQIPFDGDASKIQEGVKRALPSMGSAFWTSLSAICSALVIRLTTMLMESMFKRRVLRSIVSADPKLIQYIERRAFQENKPGALLRPHSLREVLWQQNIEFSRQLERLGSEISSAIRELPYALSPVAASGEAYSDDDPLTPSSAEPQAYDLNAVAQPQTSVSLSQDAHADVGSPIQMTTSHLATESLDAVSADLILQEMRRQTRLLEQLLLVQGQSLSAQRIERSTQEMRSLPTHLDL